MWWIIALFILLWTDAVHISRILSDTGLILRSLPAWLRPVELAMLVGALTSLLTGYSSWRSMRAGIEKFYSEKFLSKVALFTVIGSLVALFAMGIRLLEHNNLTPSTALDYALLLATPGMVIALATTLVFPKALQALANWILKRLQ